VTKFQSPTHMDQGEEAMIITWPQLLIKLLI